MAFLRYFYILPVSLLLTGCYADFTPDINTEPVLCMNALITSGEPVHVDVTHTWLYTDVKDESAHEVADAMVEIFANDNKVSSDYLPKPGDNIWVKASSPTYGVAEGKVSVPGGTEIRNVEVIPDLISAVSYVQDGVKEVFISFNIDIRLTLEDSAGVENYYLYDMSSYYGGPDTVPGVDEWGEPLSPGGMDYGSLQYDSEPIFSEHIGSVESIFGSDAWGFTFFTDRQFSGSTYTLNLRYSNAYATLKAPEEDFDSTLESGFVIDMKSISPSYYNWANYCWQMESGMLGDLGEVGLGEPIWGYSNVSTHAGVIAAQTSSKYVISLRQFLTEAMENAYSYD